MAQTGLRFYFSLSPPFCTRPVVLLWMKSSRSFFLYLASRPILTQGRPYRLVHCHTASVCSVMPRYSAASLRVNKLGWVLLYVDIDHHKKQLISFTIGDFTMMRGALTGQRTLRNFFALRIRYLRPVIGAVFRWAFGVDHSMLLSSSLIYSMTEPPSRDLSLPKTC